MPATTCSQARWGPDPSLSGYRIFCSQKVAGSVTSRLLQEQWARLHTWLCGKCALWLSSISERKLVKNALGEKFIFSRTQKKRRWREYLSQHSHLEKDVWVSSHPWSSGRKAMRDALGMSATFSARPSFCPLSSSPLSSIYTEFRLPLPTLYSLLLSLFHLPSYILGWKLHIRYGPLYPIVQNPQCQSSVGWVHGIRGLSKDTWMARLCWKGTRRGLHTNI